MLKSKKLAVTAALRSSLKRLCCLSSLLVHLLAQTSQAKSLTPSCVRLLPEVFEKEADLGAAHTVVAQLRQALLEQNLAKVSPLWHPKLRAGAQSLQQSLGSVFSSLGKTGEVSIFRVWQLQIPKNEGYTPDSSSGVLCADDAVRLLPHYGYRQQLAVWLQIGASQELGQAFFTLVPEGKGWFVGFFELQKWTHAGKDYRAWIDVAKQEERSQHGLSANLAYELAEKLLAGNRHLQFSDLPLLTAKRSQLVSREGLLLKLQKALGSKQLVSAQSLLAPEGLGLSLHYEWQGKVDGQDLEAHCHAQVKQALNLPDFALLQGASCRYQQGRDTALGIFYLGKKDLKA